jgi:hypothetical protein
MEHEQGEKAITYLQANKTHTAAVQHQEEPQRNTSVEHIYTNYHIQTKHNKTIYIRSILMT